MFSPQSTAAAGIHRGSINGIPGGGLPGGGNIASHNSFSGGNFSNFSGMGMGFAGDARSPVREHSFLARTTSMSEEVDREKMEEERDAISPPPQKDGMPIRTS